MPENIVAIAALMIPIVLFAVGGLIAITAITLNYKKRKEMFALYHQERMAAVEKGIDLPPLPDGFFGEQARPRSPRHHLLKGMIWLFVGIVLFYAFHDEEAVVKGMVLIPAAVGLAYLIYFAIVGRKEAALAEAAQKALINK